MTDKARAEGNSRFMTSDDQGKPDVSDATDVLENRPRKPADWPEGVPFEPVEVYFTPEEEAALDEVWEQIGRETAASDAARALRRAVKKRRTQPEASSNDHT